MKKLLWAIKQMLSDEKGNISSKRFVGILCGFTLCITLYENSFLQDNITPSNALVETVGALAFGCLGLASIDKYTLRKSQKQEDSETPKSE